MSDVRTDPRDYDVISVESGHHGLIAAAYLAKAGKRVLFLERQDYIGGGCVTKELAPGFRYDEHSTVHQVILSNPLLKADELGLKARFGLEYIYPDAALRRCSTMDPSWSPTATCGRLRSPSLSSLAKTRTCICASPRWHYGSTLMEQALFSPAMPLGVLITTLSQTAEGSELLLMSLKSGLDIISE